MARRPSSWRMISDCIAQAYPMAPSEGNRAWTTLVVVKLGQKADMRGADRAGRGRRAGGSACMAWLESTLDVSRKMVSLTLWAEFRPQEHTGE